MNKGLIFGLIASGLLLSMCSVGYTKTASVMVGSAEIRVELARSQVDQEKGLSGRNRLPADRGMLFLFGRKGKYPFWMKGMKFPLDFIWIDGGRVVETTEDVPVLDNLGEVSIIYPEEVVDKVLEVNAGFIKLHQVAAGDKFEVLEKN